MIFRAVISNKAHPEYGAATIPFPIPDDQYDSTIDLLHGIGVGNATAQDCRVDEITFGMPVLNRLVTQSVNLDELDYLAKRLGSFDKDEGTQFQAMASVLSLSDIKDLINLTFCCQQATVITNFSDLDRVGKHHYLNLGNGSMPLEKFEALDGQSIALDLIQSDTGRVTPYGVAYDNGMKLEPVYDGRHLPEYYYEPCIAAVTLTHAGEREILYI